MATAQNLYQLLV